MNGMMGWSGTFSDMSALTVIFCPSAGTWMCWKVVIGKGVSVAAKQGSTGESGVSGMACGRQARAVQMVHFKGCCSDAGAQRGTCAQGTPNTSLKTCGGAVRVR